VYELRFLGRALDDLSKIDRPHQRIIKQKLLILAEDPEALKNNIKRLHADAEGLYRLRIALCPRFKWNKQHPSASKHWRFP
jgi:mRNA-degrading endonuclease RelE of RelBE toxin-antitoxin system